MSGLSFSAPGANPFQAIRSRVRKSKNLVVVTYNTDRGLESFTEFLRLRPKGTRLTLFANIPGRWDAYFGREQGKEARRKSKEGIDKVLAALDPRRFVSEDVEVRFCFNNHAKIVVCDEKVAYIGSANFSSASKNNFEAGYVTESPAELVAVAEFIAEIRRESIAYNAIATSPGLKSLFEFAADVASFIETFEWETKKWSMNYHTDDLEPSFSVQNFGMPDDVIEGVRMAVAAAEAIERKWELELSTLDERSFLDAEVADRLRDLLGLAERIRSRKDLRQRDAADILSDFMGKCMDDPDAVQKSREFEEALANEETQATKRAEAISKIFIADMQGAQNAITLAFAAAPKADNTALKPPGPLKK